MAGKRALLALAMLAVLAGCARSDGLRPYAIVRRADVWQAVITDADRGRLARMAAAWAQARADIDSAGAQAELAALGPVVPAPPETDLLSETPTAVIMPAAGSYRCRRIHLGWRQGNPRNVPAVQAGQWAPCRLAADGVLLILDTLPGGAATAAPGQPRFTGTLYPDGNRRIFLGSIALPGEMGRRHYGEDGARDQFGVLSMIAPGHWRIALPWPQWTARLDLIELRDA